MFTSLGSRLKTNFKGLVRSWLALQVSHRGGTYSIERVLALEEYTTRTPIWNVILVCAATPVPLVVLALCQELVPLQDPRDGWASNYGFWIRLAITGGVVGNTMAAQANYMVEGMCITSWQMAVIAACMAAMAVAMTMPIAAYLAFPVPFTIITTSAPYMTLLAVTFRVVLGGEVFRQMLKHRDQLLKLVAFSCMEVCLAIVYPMYQALFEAAADTHFQLLVVLLLPLLKLAMKYLVTQTVVHVEDLMPEAVIVTVDFFNALYLASSMQSATSMSTVVVIMTIDFSQTAVGLFTLHRRTAGILTRLDDALGVPESERGSRSLLTSIILLCRSPKNFEMQVRTDVRVFSTLYHELTPESRTLLTKLNEVPVEKRHAGDTENSGGGPKLFLASEATPSPTARGLRKWISKCLIRNNAVKPIRPNIPLTNWGVIVPVNNTRGAEKLSQVPALLHEALAALFTTECLVLTEFLEFIIPTIYGNYVLAMVHLPSAKYHIEMVGVTTGNVGATVQTVFVYALLEFLSFVILTVIMQRNCSMRALSHLAFVLRTQMPLIQGHMLLWIVITIAFRVVHFGTRVGRAAFAVNPYEQPISELSYHQSCSWM